MSTLRPVSAGRMPVHRFADRITMASAATAAIAEQMRHRLAAQPGIRMVFAAAPSQLDTLTALREAPGIDWTRVTAFHLDEYIGLAADDPAGFANWLRRSLFDHVPIGAFNPIEPGTDPQDAAIRYAGALREAPIDIVCLGIGENGHIAFNDPPVADFDDRDDVKVVALDTACRQQQVNDGCFPSLDAVPERAITLTIPRILRAGRLFCVVPGRAKREAVRRAIHDPIDTACPASVLRRCDNAALYLDAEADPDA